MILNGVIQSDGGSSGSEGGVRCGGSETGLKKGPWTAAEDSILMEYVRKHGEGNWNAVQRNSGLNRCGKSCRLRWANHLRPNLKKGAFSAEEERLILELHAKFGNKWARMAAQLPGRTDNEIKNYWNTRVKRRQRQGLPLYPYDIHPLSAPTTPSGSVSAPTTPTNPSAATLFHFPAQTVTQIHPLSPLSSPNTLPFSPSSSSSSPPFTFHRPPPILGPPVRFNRSNGRFSLPLSPTLLQNPNLTLIQSPPPRPQHPQPASFQFPAPLTSNSMENFRTQFETQKMAMTGSISLVNSSELPSNQIIMESKGVPPANHSGLLDDLLAEAQALACEDAFKRTHCFEEKRFFDGFPKMEPSNPAHFFLGETEKEEAGNGVSLGHDDWSRLLNGIPPAVQVGEWYDGRGESSNGHSSNFGGDNGGLDMQNLASFFPVASESDVGRTPTSCPWDNLPGIC